MAKKLAMYTALFGRFEELYDPFGHLDGTYYFHGPNKIDRFYFTDLEMNGKISYPVIKKNLDYLSRVKRQRKVKIKIPDEIFDNYEYSMWVDCRPLLTIDPYFFLDFLDTDFLIMGHGSRRCAYDEGKVCIWNHKAKESVMNKQLDYYREQGFPTQNGLQYTGFMVRRHTKKLKELMDSWWREVRKFTHRDQVSLPYVLWKHNFDVTLFPENFKQKLYLNVRDFNIGTIHENAKYREYVTTLVFGEDYWKSKNS